MVKGIKTDREKAEIRRSASEASGAEAADLVAGPSHVARYMDPPADALYPLEYSYHLLGDVRGKTVLEYGCGDGHNTLLLARRGARVIALDISAELVEIARRRLRANGVASGVTLLVGSAHDLPLRNESVDIVFGIAILHHLDLELSAREVKRVLRRGGRTIFQEPMRNSRLVKAIRPLIPYRAPNVSPFEYPLTDRQLERYADGLSIGRTRYFRLPSTNLVKLIPFLRRRYLDACYRLDAKLLGRSRRLRHYATVRVTEMEK